MREGNSISLFVSPHLGGGVTPSPSLNTSTGPMSFLGGYLSDWFQVLGVPQSQMGVPPARDGVPPSRDGIPLPRDRTTERVLATQQAVCLLCSRRRTFLFPFCVRFV